MVNDCICIWRSTYIRIYDACKEGPNIDKAIEEKWIGKKTTLQATCVIHACRKKSLFFFANKLDKDLVQITLVV
jgi:hypothetical protein